MRKLPLLLPIIMLLLLALPSPVLADLTQYEYYNTGDDADFEIYADSWGAQTFTTGAGGHNVTKVRVRLFNEGNPGMVYLALRATSGGEPTGYDLTSGSLNGDAMSEDWAWYEFDVDAYYLEPATMYAIVVQAPSGANDTNTIHWRSDASAGALANGQEWTSATGGVSWAGDADDDFMFEIWGESSLEVHGAQVFESYVETGDWLIAAYYSNTLAPYYPDDNPARYFSLQLVADDDTTVLHQTPVRQWGSRPGAIYLSAATVASLEWQEDYRVRIYGNYGANPSDSYTLATADYRGDDLSQLDDWCLLTAEDMAEVDGATYTILVGDRGKMLSEDGGVLFDLGIPYLSDLRGESLFSIYVVTPEDEDKTYTDALQTGLDWETNLGPDMAQRLDDAGDVAGVDGRLIGAVGILAIYVFVAAQLVPKGHTIGGIILALPCLLMGMVLGLIAVVYMTVLASIAALLFVWHMWLRQT